MASVFGDNPPASILPQLHHAKRPLSIPIFVVSKWMGHATVKMTEEYLDLRIDESADWMTDHSGVRLEEGPGEP